MKLALIAAAGLLLCGVAPSLAASEEVEARIIVRLSFVATVTKCSQAGFVFIDADRGLLTQLMQVEAQREGLSGEDVQRLWMLGQMMSSSEVTSEACTRARSDILTWFPELEG